MRKSDQIFIVCDRNVSDFARGLSSGSPVLEIIADEEHKNIDSVLEICRWLLEKGADRSSVLFAVGGGTVSDIVGFAASIYKRGIRYINYPTTLLAQVDAGIGGKTGVNIDGYKNILGTFRFPEQTRIFPETLKSLPERDFRSGCAELLKALILADKKAYEKAVILLSEEKPDLEALAPLIEKAADIKRKIVKKDPYEKGLRRLLNLGHSYAHAIEWYESTHPSDQKHSHGEAVAIGIVKAAEISQKLELAKEGLADRLRRDFALCKLPTQLPYSDIELIKAIANDKKAQGEYINFVLLKDIAKPTIRAIKTQTLLNL